jgi:hypothetical protein
MAMAVRPVIDQSVLSSCKALVTDPQPGDFEAGDAEGTLLLDLLNHIPMTGRGGRITRMVSMGLLSGGTHHHLALVLEEDPR